LGHLYYGSNRSILEDLQQLLAHASPAADRPQLQTVAHGGQTYWICQRPQTALREIAAPDRQR
jgi:hypothetical protein